MEQNDRQIDVKTSTVIPPSARYTDLPVPYTEKVILYTDFHDFQCKIH
jgi:hypothetical protein